MPRVVPHVDKPRRIYLAQRYVGAVAVVLEHSAATRRVPQPPSTWDLIAPRCTRSQSLAPMNGRLMNLFGNVSYATLTDNPR